MHHVLLLYRLLLLHCLLLLHRLLLLRQQLNKVWWHGSNLLQLVCCHHNALLCFSYDFSLNFKLLQNFNIFQHNFSIVLWRWLQLLLRSKGPVQRDSFLSFFFIDSNNKKSPRTFC
jgi:hypothetical protein